MTLAAPKGLMWTISGKLIDLNCFRPEDVCIEDIAHSLALQCRFNGHTSELYSVAQHSVLVSKMCDSADALWGLLHDASEVYVSDLPRPVKELDGIREPFAVLEAKVQRAICSRFGLQQEEPRSVKAVDELLVSAEMLALMPALSRRARSHLAHIAATLGPVEITPWTARTARRVFLRRFAELRP